MITDYYFGQKKYGYMAIGFILEFLFIIFWIDWAFDNTIGESYIKYQSLGFFLLVAIIALWCGIIISKREKINNIRYLPIPK